MVVAGRYPRHGTAGVRALLVLPDGCREQFGLHFELNKTKLDRGHVAGWEGK